MQRQLALCTALTAFITVGCVSSPSSVEESDASSAETDEPDASSGDSDPTDDSETSGQIELPDISGRWQSPCFPQGDGTFAHLDFDIGEAAWALDYTVHGDESCGFALVTVRIEGPYELTAPSERVDDAFEARFGFDSKTITPHADPLVTALEDADCGTEPWMVDETQSVLEDGCPAFGQYPLAECPADFDLAALQGDSLRFGARPADNDMCTEDERPTALSDLALTRVQ